MKRVAFALCVVSLVTACGGPKADNAADPKAYEARFPVAPVPGPSVQRLALPPQVLVALRRADHADLRIFDRGGRPVAMASLPASSAQEQVRHDVRLEAFPILGSAGALDSAGITLNVDDLQRTRTVRLTGATTDDAKNAEPVLLGALLDTQRIVDPLVAIRLDADLPAQQPVTFEIESSADLKAWQPFAEKVIYRSRDRADALGSETIPLDAARLEGRYLRVTWHAASRLLAPVTLRGAVLTTASPASGEGRPLIEAKLPRLDDPYKIRFALPFATPVAAIRITPSVRDGILPVRVLGRDGPEQPWALIGTGTISARDGQKAAPITLTGQSCSEMEIEADRRTAGFTTAPGLRLELEPVQLVAAFNGSGPFTLAAGLSTAPDPYLQIEEIVPAYRAGGERQLPLALVDKGKTIQPSINLSAPGGDGQPFRNGLLWAVLVLGTAVLGAMVWMLWRNLPRREGPPA